MAISASQLLELAEKLLSDAESHNRAAASRAYYAAFHRCRSLADALPDPPSAPKGMHDRLVLAMSHCPPRDSKGSHKKIRKLGAQMNALRTTRIEADYSCDVAFTRGKAESAIETAKLIFAEMLALEAPDAQASGQ